MDSPAVDVADVWRTLFDRSLAGYIARAEDGDLSVLAEVRSLHADLDDAEAAAVAAYRDQGWSWSQIGRLLGITRQVATRRWGTAEGG